MIMKILKNKIFGLFFFTLFVFIGLDIYIRINNERPVVKGEKSYTVKKETIKEILSLSGEIAASEKVTLRFQTSGMLTWVGAKEGDYVKKYQGIASLDRSELEKNLKKYLNTYMKTRWDFETERDEADIKNIGSLNDDAKEAALRALDKAQFDLNNAVLDVELKDIALKYSYLYSPIEGIVTRVASPYAGVNITPTQAEFEVVNPNTIYFSATADQIDVVKIEPGKKGKIVLDSFPEKNITGVVSKISFSPKEGETGTVYEVKVSFDSKLLKNKLRLEMTGDMEFEIGKGKKMFVVPNDFIQTDKNKNKYVFTSINGRKNKIFIKIGEVMDSKTEVLSGLKEGETIIK